MATSDTLVDPAIMGSDDMIKSPPAADILPSSSATPFAPSSAFASLPPIQRHQQSRTPPLQPPQPPQPAPAFVHHYVPAAHAHLTLYLAALHGSRITAENLPGSFVPPLNHEKLLVWWRERLASAAVFLLLRRLGSSGSSGSSGAKPEGSDLVGVIMVRSHPAETSPHVAAIELLLVNMQYRELGGEQQLLATVEQQAVREGRTLLTAEAETNSPAANMYARLGFTEAGRIPGMLLRPSGDKRDLSYFYKSLAQS